MGVWIETASIKYTAKTYGVTPFVGVWIETEMGLNYAQAKRSHPSWVCGLKLRKLLLKCLVLIVTPFVGVWIETSLVGVKYRTLAVTPFVGVWIETESRGWP